MSLDPPVLDDRTFQDLVDEAKRMIPTFCPEWTNHNLSDPGVALIELFAWMTESTLYRLNRVPERYYAKFLELVGVEPFGPAAARTVVTFTLSTARTTEFRLPPGVVVATDGSADGATQPVLFQTTDELVVTPPAIRAVRLGGRDVDGRYEDITDDLRFGRAAVTVFPGLVPDASILVGFEQSLAGNVIEIEVDADTAGYGVRPDDPPIVWEAWNGDAWEPVALRGDTTGGLNCAGTISMLIGLRHEATTLDRTAAFWLRGRLLPDTGSRPWYNASPEIRSLVVRSIGGSVAAEHSAPQPSEAIGISDGRAGQRFSVSHAPVLARRDDETVEVVGRDGAMRWTEVADFADSGPTDRHFTWDSVSGEVRFGPRIRLEDGSYRSYGAVPHDGATIRVTGYRTGGGAAGNVGPGTLTDLRTSLAFVSGVTNLAPARGGADAETTAEAKVRGPMTLRTGQRAVTPRDYERAALEASTEVARAKALRPEQPGDPVSLLVVPRVRSVPGASDIDDFALSDDLHRTLEDELDRRRTLGATLEIRTPYYQGVSIAARLLRSDARPKNAVEDRARELLYRFVHPLTGGVDGTGWPFDADLHSSTVAELLESVDGVAKATEVFLFDYDLRGGRTGEAQEVIRIDRRTLFLSAQHTVVVE